MNKKIIFSVVLAGAITVTPLTTVFAASTTTTTTNQITNQTVTPTVLPMSEIIKRLETAGYRVYHKIVLDEDVYETKVINKQGDEVKVKINAKTGHLIEPKETKQLHLTLLTAAKKVEGEGYHAISEIKFDGDGYKIKALDAKGNSVKLYINGKTGEITKPWL